VKYFDKVWLVLIVCWGFFWLFLYLPAVNPPPVSDTCHKLAEMADVGAGFIATCQQVLWDPKRYDLVRVLLGTYALLVVASVRSILVRRNVGIVLEKQAGIQTGLRDD
jgi:hypothetical protein